LRDSIPAKSKEDLVNKQQDVNCYSKLNNVYFEKNKMGFFQYSAFQFFIDRFYRYWHSYYGHDDTYIDSYSELLSCSKNITDKRMQEKALEIDWRPRIKILGDNAELVRFFVSAGGAFGYCHEEIGYPNQFLLKYRNCVYKGTLVLY
jgi:hypothetical protein